MRHKNLTKCRKLKVPVLATLLAFAISLSYAAAQESLNTAGGAATGSGGKVSYSAGQVLYQTYTGTTGSEIQGVQQPYEISVITAIEKDIGIDLWVSAYPNPASDYLHLKVKSDRYTDLSFQLFDINGKLLQAEKISGTETRINMSTYIPSTYFLKVFDGKKELKIFKIIKN